ncbi:MAG TPA: GTPase [Candidatus Obscuribacterales bacterium]
MWKLQRWQWLVLATPPLTLLGALFLLAGVELQRWGLSWVWGLVAIAIVGWRWLLSQWTKPEAARPGTLVPLAETLAATAQQVPPEQVEAVLRQTLTAAQADPPLWEDWATFSQRCQTLVRDIAHLYHPEVKYPLLNIYVPQAYGLIRGTVDELDRYMGVVAPALNQVTVAQVYQTYETYRALETPLRRVFTLVDLSRWLWNPVGAIAREVSRPVGDQANQQLLVNFSQTLRETALTILCQQAIALYGGTPALTFEQAAPTAPQTQTLRALLEGATTTEAIAADPVNLLLVGRTGAGKSSLINTLFQQEQATVDVLPSTDQITSYRWVTPQQASLTLWDSPGYEQVDRPDLRQQVLAQATQADGILLVMAALDPALEADGAFLQALAQQTGRDIPILAVVAQVDRLRPLREWAPPYDWQQGDRPKEQAIRAAIEYRQTQMGQWVQQFFPVVTQSEADGRVAWGSEALAMQLVAAIAPAKAQRLAQFLRSREARILAASRLIERYALQMSSGQGLVALVKAPLLQFLATRLTGTPEVGTLLAQSLPAEQVPVVASKMMLTYELAGLLSETKALLRPGEILSLWPLLLHGGDRPPAHNAWAWGQTLVEYWTQDLAVTALKTRFDHYLAQQQATPSPASPP